MKLDYQAKIAGRLPPEKERSILSAARRLILDEGLSALSIDKIAKAAGVSKSTIYRRFDNKMEIFELLSIEMIDAFVDKTDGVLLAIDTDMANPEKVLHDIALVIRDAMKAPKHINLLRELLAEIPRNKHLNAWVKSDINPIVPQRLIKYFSLLIEAGQMQHPDPVHAASTFMTLCSDGYYSLMDTWETQAAITARLDADVNMFIKGCSISGVIE